MKTDLLLLCVSQSHKVSSNTRDYFLKKNNTTFISIVSRRLLKISLLI